jgi:hypothetical protein
VLENKVKNLGNFSSFRIKSFSTLSSPLLLANIDSGKFGNFTRREKGVFLQDLCRKCDFTFAKEQTGTKEF